MPSITELAERFVAGVEAIATNLAENNKLMREALSYRQSLVTQTPTVVGPGTPETPEAPAEPAKKAAKKQAKPKDTPPPAAEPEAEPEAEAPAVELEDESGDDPEPEIPAIDYSLVPAALQKMYERSGDSRAEAKGKWAEFLGKFRAEHGVESIKDAPASTWRGVIAELDSWYA